MRKRHPALNMKPSHTPQSLISGSIVFFNTLIKENSYLCWTKWATFGINKKCNLFLIVTKWFTHDV